jgi:hypothetical protein
LLYLSFTSNGTCTLLPRISWNETKRFTVLIFEIFDQMAMGLSSHVCSIPNSFGIFFPHLHQLSFKCNCSSQKPLPTTGIRTRDLWFCSLDLRPLDQPAVQLWASRAYILDTLFKACVIDWTVNSTSGYTKLSNFISRLSTLFLSP